MAEAVNERALILDILLENSKGAYLSVITSAVLEKYSYLERNEKAFIKAVCEGTVRHRITLDYYIDSVSRTKVSKMKPVIRELLRMSVYQLKYMDSVPKSAAINEAVKLAKKRGFSGLSGFVNGVLRNLDRSGILSKTEYPSLSVKYSMPEWITALYEKQFGSEKAEKMLEAASTIPAVVGRIVPGYKRENVIEQINSQLNVKAAFEHEILENAIVLKNQGELGAIDAFKNGIFTIQDMGSQLVGIISDVKKNSKVIDMCAAPGGKSIHIAQLMDGTGMVSARDVSENKIEKIRENADRMGINNIAEIVSDALVYNEEDAKSADIVIADLPCSGLGVLGRKSDIRYRVVPQDIEELAAMQRSIIDNAVRYLKKGGVLIYSTCTVTAKENEEQFNYITKEKGLEPLSFEELLPRQLRGRGGKNGSLQLLQGIDKGDGFYISKFKKV